MHRKSWAQMPRRKVLQFSMVELWASESLMGGKYSEHCLCCSGLKLPASLTMEPGIVQVCHSGGDCCIAYKTPTTPTHTLFESWHSWRMAQFGKLWCDGLFAALQHSWLWLRSSQGCAVTTASFSHGTTEKASGRSLCVWMSMQPMKVHGSISRAAESGGSGALQKRR